MMATKTFFESNFIKNQNQMRLFLTGSHLPARLVWIDTTFSLFFLFFVALFRRFSFSIFGCLKQYISGISCGWILKDVFQHSNEPEKWFTNEGKRKWRCWRSFIVFTKFLLDLSDIAWVVRPCDRPIENTRKGSGHTSSFLVFYLHCPHQIDFTDGKVLSTIHTFQCNICHQIFDFLWGRISFNVTWWWVNQNGYFQNLIFIAALQHFAFTRLS